MNDICPGVIRLMYVSRCAPDISRDQVEEMLTTARAFNLQHGITGVLIHGGDRFMQVLEGPEHDVIQLYARIVDDRRHYDCGLIRVMPITTHLFPDWDMHTIYCASERLQDISRFRDPRNEARLAEEFTRALSQFVSLLEPE